MNIFGVIAASIKAGLSSVLDTFNRANGTLGTAASNWTTVRGTWSVVSNQANTSTAASSYPLATLSFTSMGGTLGVDGVGPGAGTAFWVTDSGTWWGTYVDGVQTCQTCYTPSTQNYTTCNNGSNQNFTTCYNTSNLTWTNTTCYNAGTQNFTTCYNAANYNTNTCINIGYCYNGNAYTCGTGLYNTGTAYTCSTGYYYYNTSNSYSCGTGVFNISNAYSCGTGLYNNAYTSSCNCTTSTPIKLIKSVANVITALATFAMASTVVGFKTLFDSTTGVVTVRGYSGAGYTTQIGTDQTYTATGYTAKSTHGIMVAPVTYSTSQTANIDNFQKN